MTKNIAEQTRIMNKELDLLRQYKIGILAGGSSNEREISLKSGRAVLKVLSEAGLRTVFFDVQENDISFLIDRIDVDVVFMALHGRFGEDGTIQSMLETRNIPYTGSGPEASSFALDKLASKRRFRQAGLNVPEYKVIRKDESILDFDMDFPCVVKPRYEGSSIGLSVVSSQDDFSEAINKSFKFGEDIIVEKFISGREITVGIIEGRPLPLIEIITAGGIYDFSAKYESGNTKYIVPAKLDRKWYQEVQKTGLKAHRILGCTHFSRVDVILSPEERQIFVLEVNTIPGLTERSLLPMAARAEGLDFLGLCVKMLYAALLKE